MKLKFKTTEELYNKVEAIKKQELEYIGKQKDLFKSRCIKFDYLSSGIFMTSDDKFHLIIDEFGKNHDDYSKKFKTALRRFNLSNNRLVKKFFKILDLLT